MVEPLTRLKRLLETDDGEAADFMIDARSQLSGVLTPTEIETLSELVGDFDFESALKCLSSIAGRLSLNLRMTRTDNKLVLIVDDTPTNVGVISGVLKDAYRTKVATNGEKALVLATAAEKPDLILLDVMMPGMDGYEVCRRLKANPVTRDIPVIFLTAKTDAVDEENGFEVGAVDYIHKPFSGPIVLARVRTQLALQDALARGARGAQSGRRRCCTRLLPKKAADEIRSIGTVIPRRYENVAVLFCDVTNFTAYCDKHEPEDVVSRLDALFVIFERVDGKAWAGEDQDHRRRLHGGRRAAPGNPGPDRVGRPLRPRNGIDPDRRAVSAGKCGSACTPGPWSPASSARSATSSTSGATPSMSRRACRTNRRQAASP